MKRLLALLAGGLGLRAFLRRRGGSASLAPPVEELRAKLADARAVEVEEPSAEEPDVDSRRADVHERARRAIDELGDS